MNLTYNYYENVNVAKGTYEEARIKVSSIKTKHYKFYETKINLTFYEKRIIRAVIKT